MFFNILRFPWNLTVCVEKKLNMFLKNEVKYVTSRPGNPGVSGNVLRFLKTSYTRPVGAGVTSTRPEVFNRQLWPETAVAKEFHGQNCKTVDIRVSESYYTFRNYIRDCGIDGLRSFKSNIIDFSPDYHYMYFFINFFKHQIFTLDWISLPFVVLYHRFRL